MYNKKIIVFNFILLVNFPVFVAFLLANKQKSTEKGLKACKFFVEMLMSDICLKLLFNSLLGHRGATDLEIFIIKPVLIIK
jgi:hypothetical protein